jgi:hypothetical protein
MLALSVTHAHAQISQQAEEALREFGPIMMGGDSFLEKLMTTAYGLERMIEIQGTVADKLREAAIEIDHMQEASSATQENVKDGVARVVCACCQAISMKAR